jgi:enoyl-CoA hydratase/carnithine racemase
MSHITVTIEGNLARLVLSNPPQNRLAQEFFDELRDAISLIAGSGARAALLSAEGPDFSYGGDIVPWPTLSPEQLRAAFEKRLGTVNQWERLPVLTVAAVQRLCFGGGFELAIRSDIIFAGASARFGHPEQSLGIVTMLGGIQRVAERVGKAFAMEWALTSEQVPAQTMLERGVINRVVADESLLEEAAAFARKLADGPTRAHLAHKALLRIWTGGGLAAADGALLDLALPLFETEDVKSVLPAAVEAFTAGLPRPTFKFKGR